jgi:hypothetical protein
MDQRDDYAEADLLLSWRGAVLRMIGGAIIGGCLALAGAMALSWLSRAIVPAD